MDTNDILTERAKTHGSFKDHARITQHLKHTMQSEPSWKTLTMTQKESLEMIAHKIGRVLAGNASFKDHWDDIAGYAKLIANEVP